MIKWSEILHVVPAYEYKCEVMWFVLVDQKLPHWRVRLLLHKNTLLRSFPSKTPPLWNTIHHWGINGRRIDTNTKYYSSLSAATHPEPFDNNKETTLSARLFIILVDSEQSLWWSHEWLLTPLEPVLFSSYTSMNYSVIFLAMKKLYKRFPPNSG